MKKYSNKDIRHALNQVESLNTLSKHSLPKEIEKYEPVLIHWVESQKIDENMRKIGDFGADFPENCYALGFLVSDNLGNKILAPLLHTTYSGNLKIGPRIVIPPSAIKEIRKIQFSGPVNELQT